MAIVFVAGVIAIVITNIVTAAAVFAFAPIIAAAFAVVIAANTVMCDI
jgi:hypothetical protein